MRASLQLRDYLKRREKFRAKPYRDSEGNWTIGYGHLIRRHEKKTLTHLTEDQADALMLADVSPLESYLNGVMANFKVQLNQHQFDAVLSFMFNAGLGAFDKSTMLKKLRIADFEGAAAEFDRWVYITVPAPDGNGTIKRKLRGLVNRRRMDRAIFEEAKYAA